MSRPTGPASTTRRRACALAVLLALGAPLAAPLGAEPAGAVRLEGDLQRRTALDVEQLRSFAAKAQLTYTSSREVSGKKTQSVVRGVSLRAILEQAGLAERDRFDWRKAVVIAVARDGYRAVFSWPELFNTEGGGQVVVAYERDGAPLGPGEGPIALHAPGDIRTGPRHVKWLERLEVRILRD